MSNHFPSVCVFFLIFLSCVVCVCVCMVVIVEVVAAVSNYIYVVWTNFNNETIEVSIWLVRLSMVHGLVLFSVSSARRLLLPFL